MTLVTTDADTAAGAANTLRSTATIRERARFLLQRARAGESRWFTLDDNALPAAVDEVAAVTLARFPDLTIPFHSRWRHFEAGGVHRAVGLDAHAMIDLAVVSVLLDAGAGPDWHYDEADSGLRLTRSERLGVASWHAFAAGLFSSDPAHPLRADAAGLRALDADRLADAFQVGPSNPMVGVDGRVSVLHRLGDALARQPDTFGAGRPGGLFDVLTATGGPVTAPDILSRVLTSFSRIWPDRKSVV